VVERSERLAVWRRLCRSVGPDVGGK